MYLSVFPFFFHSFNRADILSIVRGIKDKFSIANDKEISKITQECSISFNDRRDSLSNFILFFLFNYPPAFHPAFCSKEVRYFRGWSRCQFLIRITNFYLSQFVGDDNGLNRWNDRRDPIPRYNEVSRDEKSTSSRLLFGPPPRTFVFVFYYISRPLHFLLRSIIHVFHQLLHTRVSDFLLSSPLLVTACTISFPSFHCILYT